MSRRALRGDNHATSRREAEVDAQLRQSLEASGLAGKPLHLTTSPFKAEGSALITGMLGAPAWALRLKQIHDERTQLSARLDAGWKEYARRYRTRPEEFAKRWHSFVTSLDLTKLNTLIKKHNDYYPIEARLPIVWPKGHYLIPVGIEYPQAFVTVQQILDDYPADLDFALYFTGQDPPPPPPQERKAPRGLLRLFASR